MMSSGKWYPTSQEELHVLCYLPERLARYGQSNPVQEEGFWRTHELWPAAGDDAAATCRSDSDRPAFMAAAASSRCGKASVF